MCSLIIKFLSFKITELFLENPYLICLDYIDYMKNQKLKEIEKWINLTKSY